MDNKKSFPSCLIYLFMVAGITLAVVSALLLSQVDTLQQRALLPQATLPVVNFEATLAAGDLTVIVITGEPSQSESSTLTPTALLTAIQTPVPTVENQSSEVTLEPPSEQVVVPTCSVIPDGWIPYEVEEDESLRSLAIQLRTDEDAIASANCLSQPHLKAGQIIYLPLPSEATTGNSPSESHNP